MPLLQEHLWSLKTLVSAGASPELEDLVMRLLDKNSATRIGWAELPGHPFWKAPLPVREMPPEPHLENFIAEHGLLPPPFSGSLSHQVLPHVLDAFRRSASVIGLGLSVKTPMATVILHAD